MYDCLYLVRGLHGRTESQKKNGFEIKKMITVTGPDRPLWDVQGLIPKMANNITKQIIYTLYDTWLIIRTTMLFLAIGVNHLKNLIRILENDPLNKINYSKSYDVARNEWLLIHR